MMKHIHIEPLLQDHIDGLLDEAQRKFVDDHLATCETCREAFEQMRALVVDISELPRDLNPPTELWHGIEARLSTEETEGVEWDPVALNGEMDRDANPPPVKNRIRLLPTRFSLRVAAAITVVSLSLGGLWLAAYLSNPAWTVATLEGSPRIANKQLATKDKFHVGQLLETDATSRAQVDVGAIGKVEVAPNSKLKLLSTKPNNHRFALEQGSLHARIWAPPRLFFVETPSALAIDLGCEYTLDVDDFGNSLLHVTSGYVELAFDDREAVVPAGFKCVARANHGPGTPFDEEATVAFQTALAQYDFEEGGDAALTDLLREARPTDITTLWHLMVHASETEKTLLVDRMWDLTPPPPNVTRSGILAGNVDMIEDWQQYYHIDLDLITWWKFWKKKNR